MVDLKAICAPLTMQDTRMGVDRNLWRQAESEEIIRHIEEAETMRWIQLHQKPKDRIASYYSTQPSVKIKKGVALRRMRGTYGGTRSDYEGPVSEQTADLTTIKCLMNAAVSEDANLATADIKNFYLGTPLERYEYMYITRKQLPDDIIERYDLETFMNRGTGSAQTDYVMVEISKGIYGLPQAGRLAQEKLVKHLATHGYRSTANTPCLFKHESKPVAFTLVVDDFLIKYGGRSDLDHLLDSLREAYEITVDIEAVKYVGIDIAYNRTARTISLSMPEYVGKALQRLGVTMNNHVTDSPLIYTPPSYGGNQQYAVEDTSRPLNSTEIHRLQQIIGVFLYYARAVDPTMLCPLNKFASLQAKGTKNL
jgi:hypothetical protein